jgi:serine/threonine-protein kinase
MTPMTDSTDSTTPGPAQEPTLLDDRYALAEVIGRGGMAEVYEAMDTRLGRRVAVKVLRGELARDPSFHVRFRREAQAAASLNHPNVVAVFDSGEGPLGGQTVPYIVMEFVDGATLRDLMKTGTRMRPDRALEIIDGVLAALDYSHRQGIIHRDIKPGNIIITKAGEVKVTDFGIARVAADSAATMTGGGSVMGTAQYLSPEQARGDTVDTRTDLYSAGCVLYEMLTGRPPFVGESPVSVAYQHVRENPPVPSTHDAEIPPSCDAICMRALQKNPDARYQTAAEMRADVERATRGFPVDDASTALLAAVPAEATTVMPATTGVEEEEKRRGWLVAVGVLLALAAVGTVAFLLFRGGDDVRVPDLTGLTLEQARTELTNRGLTLGAVTPQESTEPKDQVLAQDPPVNSTIPEGSTVSVTVSAGPGQTAVPTLVGLSRDAALQQLTNAGLKLGKLNPVDSSAPEGQVVASNPPEGTSVEKGSAVDLDVSTGKVTVPNVVSKTEAEATSELQQLGLSVQSVPQVTDAVAPGTVVQQTPRSGAVVDQGTTVTISVARAPSPSPTPTPTTASPTPTPTPTPAPTTTP